MNTELLRTFLEVTKTRHFGRAADNLYLTQSAVSFRVRQLEEMIGLPLFTRERNNILLTPAGERLLPHAENILAAWQLALQDVAVSQGQGLQLSLGGTSNLWDTFLQTALPRLMQQIEGLYVRTEVSTSQELTRALLGGRLDLAVLLDPPKSTELESQAIGQIELALVCSQPADELAQLSELGYIFVDWGTAFNLQQARLLPEPVAPILHTAQSQIALEFLRSHGGAAFLPTALVQGALRQKQLFELPHIERVEREVYAAYNSRSVRTDVLQPVIRQLQACPQLQPSPPRKSDGRKRKK